MPPLGIEPRRADLRPRVLPLDHACEQAKFVGKAGARARRRVGAVAMRVCARTPFGCRRWVDTFIRT